MSDVESSDEVYILPELRNSAEITRSSTIPAKSKNRYELTYQSFQKWQGSRNINSITENVLLKFFQEQSAIKTPPTLWSLYSMLKSMINLQLNINIGNYTKLLAFLKNKAKGYTSAKPKVFTDEQITKFINEAPDIIYLATKVVLIFGVSGACRTDELVNICIHDIEIHGPEYLIKIPATGTCSGRSFVICGQYFYIVRKYHQLRPPNVQSNRFFLNYQKGKCTAQVIGKNKFCKMAQQIAQFLKLEDANRYTGYSYRRISTGGLTKDSLRNIDKTVPLIISSIYQPSNLNTNIMLKDEIVDYENIENTLVNINNAVTQNISSLTDICSTTADEYTISDMVTNFPSEVVATRKISLNSEPIFCDVNNVKIEAVNSSSQVDETTVESSNTDAVFCDANVKIEEANSPLQAVETLIEPPNSDVYFCDTNVMNKEVNSPSSNSELVFCDETDLVKDVIPPKQLPGTIQWSSNLERVIQDPNNQTIILRKKSFIIKRRYVGNWKKSDMNSPILAGRFFDFAMSSINKKNQALKRLGSENRRLTLRIESLNNLVDQMKKKKANFREKFEKLVKNNPI